MLLSVLSHNLEVCFNISTQDIKELHDLDMQLLRGCLLLGAKSTQCLVFLELGLTIVYFIIKKKRILYLHHLLTTDQSSLVSKVFWKQTESPTKGTWVSTVIKDLIDFNIKLSFSQISELSKAKFKSIVKQSCEKASFASLIKEKESLSKGNKLHFESLKIQSYFLPENGLSAENMRRIYQTKCRELDVKANYPSAYSDNKCPASGCKSEDNQKHLFESACFTNDHMITNNETKYEDVFSSNIEEQIRVTDILFLKLEARRRVISCSGVKVS